MTTEHRSGYVALAGRPNVGKSTLLNALLRRSLLPVSPKPQTTRRRQLAILTTPGAQIVFVDTPGLHNPQHKLGQLMNDSVLHAADDADLIVAMFDLHQPPGEEDERVAMEVLARTAQPILVLNKIDISPPDELQRNWEAYEALIPGIEPIGISALRGDNLEQLIQIIGKRLPEGPQYFPPDELTDAYERDLAADLVRAAALELLREEVPHSLDVRIDEYKERGRDGAFVAATVFVERESQKGIVIGKGGKILKQIGTRARQLIEEMTGRSVYLDLRVKVLPGWRNDERALKRLGYTGV